MMRQMSLLTAIILVGLAAAQTGVDLSQAGYLPAGTEIVELRTADARHYSNGDGTITAVIEALNPGGPNPQPFDVTTLSSGYTCFIEKMTVLWITYYSRTTGDFHVGYYTESGGTIQERGMAEWQLGSIPDNATVSSVSCSTRCFNSGYNWPTSVPLYEMTNRPSTTPNDNPGNTTLFNDAGDGVQYATYTGFANDIWLHATLNGAAPLVQSRLTGGDWFALGYSYTGSGSAYEAGFYGAWGNYAPKLRVTYTVPATHDVGVTQILAPTGTVDSGAQVTPSCIVQNYTSSSASYIVRLKVGPNGSYYNGTASVTNHPGNSSLTVTGFSPPMYANWPRNTAIAVTCSTELTGDANNNNDKATTSVQTRVRDVQPTIWYQPPTNVDSGVTVTPSVRVQNNGTVLATFNVRFWTSDGFSSTKTVTNLSANGGQDIVDFDPWTITTRGTVACTCATLLSDDMIRANDSISRNVSVAVRDVRAVAITAPVAVDSGVPVTPEATVQNLGTAAATFPVRLFVDGVPHGSDKWVNNLAPGLPPVAVTFDEWTPNRHGSFVLRCSTMLANDMVPINDTVSRTVSAMVRDVRPMRINVPAAEIDSGPPLLPNVTVENVGPNPSGPFDVRLTIGAWSDLYHLDNLAPGETARIGFHSWQPQRGTWPIELVTLLAGDANPGNDTIRSSVTVAVRDIGVGSILAPAGNVRRGTVITPRIAITNYGNQPALANAELVIKDEFGTVLHTAQARDVAVPVAGLDNLPLEPDWPATNLGRFQAVARTVYGDDMHPENDTDSTYFDVVAGSTDIGVQRIWSPAGTIDTGTTVVPTVWIYNPGELTADGDAFFTITHASETVYSATAAIVGLAPGESTEISFDGWPGPHPVGSYVGRCSVALAGDENPANDTLSRPFTVVARTNWPSGWQEVSNLPAPPSNRQVKDGGWIAGPAANGLLYAIKGNKVRDFYAYDPIADSWTRKADFGSSSSRLPGKGGAAIADGGRYIYAVKGNNSLEFYRYDVTTDSWQALREVPPGNHKIKAGADLAYVNYGDTGYVYLLKGYRNEFYRYNTVSGEWQTETRAPDRASPKYDKGSFLVGDGTGVLYVHQAKFHRLYRYDVATRAWSADTLRGMPFVSRVFNRTRQSKDGGCAAWSNGIIYALKGNNTQEYYRYFPAHDSWQELDTMPQWGRLTQRKRKVKSGADITSYEPGVIFALKGNKTNECWRWKDWPTAYSLSPQRDGIATSYLAGDYQLTITPNPLRTGFLCLTTGPLYDRATLSVFDPLGRRVLTRPLTRSSAQLDLRSLPSGVYLLRIDLGSSRFTRKLVIEH